jgi:hypothetical protein
MSARTPESPHEVSNSSHSLALDVVVPVHDQPALLAVSVGLLHGYLMARAPFTWRVTIVDHASTDRAGEVAICLAAALPSVRAVRIGREGRGRALRAAWSRSEAAVLASVHADVPMGLDTLLPLVTPLVSGESDVAWGQHGFTAVRADVARRLFDRVRDDERFFGGGLRRYARHDGLRIHELPAGGHTPPGPPSPLFDGPGGFRCPPGGFPDPPGGPAGPVTATRH